MATTGAQQPAVDVGSLNGLHWIGIIAALVSAAVHLLIGVRMFPSAMGISFILAGLGFIGGVGLLVIDYRRRAVYAVGILFTLVQIVLWYVINFAGGTKSFPGRRRDARRHRQDRTGRVDRRSGRPTVDSRADAEPPIATRGRRPDHRGEGYRVDGRGSPATIRSRRGRSRAPARRRGRTRGPPVATVPRGRDEPVGTLSRCRRRRLLGRTALVRRLWSRSGAADRRILAAAARAGERGHARSGRAVRRRRRVRRRAVRDGARVGASAVLRDRRRPRQARRIVARTVGRQTELGRRLDMAFDTFGFRRRAAGSGAVGVAAGLVPLDLRRTLRLSRGRVAAARPRAPSRGPFPTATSESTSRESK